MMKWKNVDSVLEWFSSMGMPLPIKNAFLAATIEILGAILLLSGVVVYSIGVPPMVVMLVAIFIVHSYNGFEDDDNGFYVPLHNLIVLFTWFVYGGGHLGLQGMLTKFINRISE